MSKPKVPNAETQAAMKEARQEMALKNLKSMSPFPPFHPMTKERYDKWIATLKPLDPDVICKANELVKDVQIDLDESIEDDDT